MSRQLHLNIFAGKERGFWVEDASGVVACFSDAAELARWIEDRARAVDPPLPAQDTTPAMPRVVTGGNFPWPNRKRETVSE